MTLTNMTGRQIQKIVAYGISPINVSVHTTDPSLRMAMLGNKRAGRILDQLRLLTEGGIEVNAQIVLCPGVNDGQALTDTLKDLERLGENLRSVAVVPLGKTRFREGLAQIPDVDQQVARETIKRITAWWEGLLESRGSRWVFAADEFYLKAQWEVPKTHCYEGFTLLEDGVGLLRFFSSKMTQVLDKKLSLTGKYTVATGKAAESFLIEQFGRLTELHLGLEIQVVGIENHFFGEKITVSGLVVGRDLMDQLMGGPPLGTLLIPSAMLRDNTEVFLDDVTLNDLKEHLQCDVVKVPVDPEALVAIIERRKNHG